MEKTRTNHHSNPYCPEEKVLEELHEIAEQIENHIHETEDTRSLSALFLTAKDFEDRTKEICAAKYREVKAEIADAEKISRAVRKKVEDVTKEAAAKLNVWYNLEQEELDKQAADLLREGDHAKLAELPDGPELAEGVTFAELKRAVVVDSKEIPRNFLVVDEKAVLKVLKDGGEVPGAILVTEKSFRRASKKGEGTQHEKD